MSTVTHPEDPTLSRWLRLLWGATPTLHLGSEVPFISAGGIHLPTRPMWHQHCAAAAHAAAHLVYSPTRFDADGLVPIARTLLALLEDARIEALAMRELPGLARLWRPLHTATAADGQGCEPLMNRLARALADPGYCDPHFWVRKGRALFYLDEPLGLPALRTPAELRGAAMRLGHDIGQMRLPFNAKGYRPSPPYRDDHRWMWAADQLTEIQAPAQPEPSPAGAQPAPDEPEWATPETITRHPEWDRLIHRLRPDWCRVIEQVPARLNTLHSLSSHRAPPSTTDAAAIAASRQLSQRLLSPLRRLTRPRASRGCNRDGEVFDLDALVSWCSARRGGLSPDGRVYVARQRQAARAAVWLLVDRSASTSAALGAGRRGTPGSSGSGTVLQAAACSAAATALALQALGVPCTVAAFSANGRQAVRLITLKTMGQPADDSLAPRLLALGSGGSTRLGAALRHAAGRLIAGNGTRRAGARWVLLLSDGQPHDVDVHDPQYLVDDARHAVQAARRRAVQMACLSIGLQTEPAALRIFGRHGTQLLTETSELPRALRRMMA